MRSLAAIVLAAAFVAAGTPAFAAKEGKNTVRAQREASCKAQAAQKYSAIHFIKRNRFVTNCMGGATTGRGGKRA